MNLWKKTEALVFGVAIALAALAGGWQMNAWAVSAYENHTGIFPIILTAALAVLALNIGVVLFVVVLVGLRDISGGDVLFAKLADALYAIGNAACFCFVFGAIGAPLHQGMYVSLWGVLLVAGFIPLLYFAKEILSDVGSLLRQASR